MKKVPESAEPIKEIQKQKEGEQKKEAEKEKKKKIQEKEIIKKDEEQHIPLSKRVVEQKQEAQKVVHRMSTKPTIKHAGPEPISQPQSPLREK